MTETDDALASWDDIRDDFKPSALLVGNGLSINLWAGFSYASLFGRADLGVSGAEVFAALATSNFEAVLECIHHARLVLQAQGQPTSEVDALYEEVRDALFGTVGSSHVPWSRFPVPTHTRIAVELDSHTAVFATNYDLCLYWSQLESQEPVNLADYFWGPGQTFDLSDVSLHTSRTPVHYLHGALHLWTSDAGVDGKWTHSGGSLLDLAAKYPPASDRRPLFVSEAGTRSKLRTIRRSEYLSFCLDQLESNDDNLVVFGLSMAENDRHIAAAVNAGRRRKIAVSMRPGGGDNAVIEEKSRINQLFPGHEVIYYDSTTHPLGDPSLRIPDGPA